MFTETQKLHLIEEVLKTDNEAMLYQLEAIVNNAEKHKKTNSFSPRNLVGRWTKKDAELIETIINEGCEQINADEWK